MSWQLSVYLLLSRRVLNMGGLLLLLLLGTLQNLWRKLAWHARVLRLAGRNLLGMVTRHGRSLSWSLLRRRGSDRIRDGLTTHHHGLHLFQAHHLPRCWWECLRLCLRLRLLSLSRLLWLETPDISPCL